MSGRDPEPYRRVMTVLWFLIWLVANNVGGNEPLLLDPVNAWTGTLIAAVALDLGGSHAASAARS
jgi:hypothetical protein